MTAIEYVMKAQTERVLLLMAEDNIHSQKELAKKIMRGPSLISGYLNAEDDLNETFVLRLQACMGWSSKWILKGTGPKRISTIGPVSQSMPNPKQNEGVPLSMVDETDVTRTASGSEFRDLDNGMVLMTIELVDELAIAGYPQGYKDPEFIEDLPKHSIVRPRRDKSRYRAFVVKGDSMDDNTGKSISEGDIVTGRFIEPDNWNSKSFITVGKDYIIVHQDGVFIKRIGAYNVEEGLMLCTSTNENKDEFPDFTVRLTEVYEVLRIIKVEKGW